MVVTCRICGCTASNLVSETVSDAPEAAIYRCGGCSIVYLHPIMTASEEAYFYEKDFPAYMEARSAPGGKEPASHFESNYPEGVRRLELLKVYLSSDWDVLEIGSSTGYFLDVLKPHVRTVTGIEPGTAFASYAAEHAIPTVPSLAALGHARFDAMLIYYVLEHLRDPIGFLQQLTRLLKPGGQLFIEVPNVNDALLTTYRVQGFAPFYWQRAHYQYFSHTTLLDVLRRAGFSAEVHPVQRYDLSNHVVWMLDGKPGGKGRFREIFTRELEEEYANCLKNNWICDTVFGIATPDSMLHENYGA